MSESFVWSLHPQLRLLLLLCMAVFLPLQSGLYAGVVCLLLVACCWRVDGLLPWWQSVLRLKWLFISVLVLYGWFTPGLPVVEVVGARMPTAEGLELAASKALLLVCLVGLVSWLIRPLRAETLADALSRLLRPLSSLGVDTDRFTRRVAFTLATVSGFQQELAGLKAKGWLSASGTAIARIERDDFVVQGAQGQVVENSIPPFPGLTLINIAVFALACMAFLLPALLINMGGF